MTSTAETFEWNASHRQTAAQRQARRRAASSGAASARSTPRTAAAVKNEQNTSRFIIVDQAKSSGVTIRSRAARTPAFRPQSALPKA